MRIENVLVPGDFENVIARNDYSKDIQIIKIS